MNILRWATADDPGLACLQEGTHLCSFLLLAEWKKPMYCNGRTPLLLPSHRARPAPEQKGVEHKSRHTGTQTVDPLFSRVAV